MNSESGIGGSLDWETIVRTHGQRVFRVAQRILGSVQDAEDVSQEVFLEAYRVYRSSEVQCWIGLLVRLATLRSIDYRRRKRPDQPLNDHDCPAQFDPSSSLIKAELADRLRTAIGFLSGQQATVFVMSFYEQMTREEISKALGISSEAVSTSLYKARQGLSKSMMLSQEGNSR